MECKKLMDCLEGLSPASFALEWDNVGLLAGRDDKEISSVMIALDATDNVVDQAVDKGADMLLTHHPMIFKARKRINNSDPIGRRLLKILGNDMCYYAMHTNFDVMGMADAVADELGLIERDVLQLTFEDDISREGIGRIGCFKNAMDLDSCARMVRRIFNTEPVKVFGNPESSVVKAAVCPGAGSSVIGDAIKAGVDVLITGDIGHHSGIDAVAEGLSIIDAGHYGLEYIFTSYMETFLKRKCPDLKVYKAAQDSPFWYV